MEDHKALYREKVEEDTQEVVEIYGSEETKTWVEKGTWSSGKEGT